MFREPDPRLHRRSYGPVHGKTLPRLDACRVLVEHFAMTRETLLEIDNRRPFVPYSLRLNNGDVVEVQKPDHCLITEDNRTLVFNESGGRLKFISIANITMVE